MYGNCWAGQIFAVAYHRIRERNRLQCYLWIERSMVLIFVTSQNFILLTCVDSKRTTAAYCIRNVVYSFSVVVGGPVAGE